MDCACLFNKRCGYGYYKKGVYIQVIRSTARQCFRGRQHGPQGCESEVPSSDSDS